MQISPRKVSVNSKGFGVDFEEESFGIGDVSVIMSILRDKMYSDPIGIICQEIMANARDAHRESGIPERPIEVTLPTADDPFYRVRDFGPGITRQRMRDIFTQYGNSTKRDSDLQTGGFGLGAKTPWAYDDYFFINTVTPEDDGEMTLRSYRAYIDESRIGKIALKDYAFAEGEAQGTEIVVPVQEKDFGTFCIGTKRAGEWWELAGFVAPTLFHNNDSAARWRDLEELLVDKGLDWMLMDQYKVSQEERHPIAVVDGFPYRLNLASLQIRPGQTFHVDMEDSNLVMGQSSVPWVMFFETGQLELAANREALDYSETTIGKVLESLREALQDVADDIEKQLNVCTDLWQANIVYTKFMKRMQGIGSKVWLKEEWKGITLHGDVQRVDLDSIDADMQRIIYNEDNMQTSEPLMERFRNYRSFYYNNPAVLCVDDTTKDRIPTSKVWTAMTEADVEEAYVLKIRKQGSLDNNSWADHVKSVCKEMDKEFNLSDMVPVMLSEVEPSKLPRKQRRQTRSKVKGVKASYVMSLKKVVDSGGSYTTCHNYDEDVAKLTGYYMFTYYKDYFLENGKRHRVSSYSLPTLLKGCGLKEVWAIRSSLSDKIGEDVVPFVDLITEEVDRLLVDEDLTQAWREHKAVCGGEYLRELQLENSRVRSIMGVELSIDHVLQKYLRCVDDMNKRMVQIQFLNTAMTVLGRKDWPKKDSRLAVYTKQIRREYPLLVALSAGHHFRELYKCSNVNKAAVEYIKAVDSGCIAPM